MVYGTYNELVIGAFVNQLITRGPHIVESFVTLVFQLSNQKTGYHVFS